MSATIPEKNAQAPQQPAPIQTTPPVQKNTKLLKVAVIGLVVTLIIILSEVGYLVFSGYGRTYFQLKSESQNETAVPASSPTPVPTPSVEFVLPEEIIQSNKVDGFLYILEGLESKETFIKAATINSAYGGVVTSTSQGEVEGVGFRYIIDAKNDLEQTIRFRFSKEEIDSAEIYLVSNNNEKISFGDIKPDDNLTVKVVSDLLDSSPDSKLSLEIERDN
jgi:hypothetical protein